LKDAARKITNLEVQGATNVAVFAVKSLIEFTKRNSKLPRAELRKMITQAERILYNCRPTEPAMRNGLMYIIGKLREDEMNGIFDTDLSQMVEIYGTEYERLLNESLDRIAKYGARLIPENIPDFVVQTHCHSQVVEEIFLEAAAQGKKFTVISTETRPFYQGRITAKRLAKEGIRVIQIVDSAMRWAVRNLKSNLIIIGADSVTSEGTVLNKIGSRLLALVAREDHVPMYVATPLLKYNPGTAFGYFEKIEMRDTEEIWRDWTDRPTGVEFLNPAFETVSRTYINGLVTEVGIFPSGEIHNIFRHAYPFLFDAYHDLEDELLGMGKAAHKKPQEKTQNNAK
jgi:ribose 1,5-bisphosphate isomerase